MDKRKLLTKKPIIASIFNQKENAFFVEIGKDLTSEDLFVSLVFQIETIAELLNLPRDSAMNQLQVYWKGRKQE